MSSKLEAVLSSLRTSAAAAAILTGGAGEPERKNADPKATPRRGRKGRTNTRIVRYERTGPFHRQVGIKWLAGECWPLMQTFYRHAFLHVTKGWRYYNGGPTISMPRSMNPNAVPARLAFYGRPTYRPA